MKKYIISLVTMIAAICPVMAEQEIPDNSLYVIDATMTPGQTAVLSIGMKNSAEVQSLQVDVTLPVGLTVAKDKRGGDIIELNADRSYKHTLHSRLQNADATDEGFRYRIAVLQGGYAFDGNDGELITLTIDVPADFKPGVYPVTLSTVELSGKMDKYDKGIVSKDVFCNGNITIADPTAVNAAVADNAESAVEIYDTNGTKLPALRSGINIVKDVNSGTARKVTVK